MSRLSPATAWALYDWANSAFAAVVMAGFFPLFFKQYWASGLTSTASTFGLGLATTLASLFLILTAPLLGGLADALGWRKRILALFTLLGALATLMLGFIPGGAWVWALALYALASLAFMASMTAYDALLPLVADAEHMARVSARGYALGYLGGGLILALCVLMSLKPSWFGLSASHEAVRLAFVLTGLWWLLFALPLLWRVNEPHVHARSPLGHAMRASLLQWRTSWRQLAATPPAWTFLFAYWLYIDGVDTIIRMAVDFGLSIGLPAEALIVALLLVQFIGFPATLAYAALAERIGLVRALFLGLAIYGLILFYAMVMDSVWEFYLLAVGVAMVQGGVQALSRAYFARLIPQGREGAFFALYNMLGKFAALLGPILVGTLTWVVGDHRLGLVAVLPLFVAGAWLLWRAERLGQVKAY